MRVAEQNLFGISKGHTHTFYDDDNAYTDDDGDDDDYDVDYDENDDDLGNLRLAFVLGEDSK